MYNLALENADKLELARLHSNGESARSIAKKLGTSHTHINTHLKILKANPEAFVIEQLELGIKEQDLTCVVAVERMEHWQKKKDKLIEELVKKQSKLKRIDATSETEFQEYKDTAARVGFLEQGIEQAKMKYSDHRKARDVATSLSGKISSRLAAVKCLDKARGIDTAFRNLADLLTKFEISYMEFYTAAHDSLGKVPRTPKDLRNRQAEFNLQVGDYVAPRFKFSIEEYLKSWIPELEMAEKKVTTEATKKKVANELAQAEAGAMTYDPNEYREVAR